MNRIFDLKAIHDSHLSFYGKATIEQFEGENKDLLCSFGVPVCVVQSGKVSLLEDWSKHRTTLRHVKEFLLQHGFRAESKKQIGLDYGCASNE